IPGFQLGDEAGLYAEGFNLGHSELILSSNIDAYFYGQTTLAIAEHEGETEIEIEEAFIQTLDLAEGYTLSFGRLLSSFGYLNNQHAHAWDFNDAPLMYRALFGNQLIDDGLQLNYLLPSDQFIEFSAELFNGNGFPGAGNEDGGIGAYTLSITSGGDISSNQSWQLGLSHWRASNIIGRTSAGHDHGTGTAEIPSFDGDSQINAIDLVYKWSANDGSSEQLEFQLEYFQRDESGTIILLNSSPLDISSYEGDQSGGYVQTVYQFARHWRSGLRVDQLSSDNTGSNITVLDDAGLIEISDSPRAWSWMLEWIPSEFSRLRLQYTVDETGVEKDQQLYLQYSHSLGAHGSHAY
ncbi:MAG: hypothetical protein OQL09_08660, partial [Gammaproteobacteria bacterium]|nr:hypothetical protein [Gammaproteobacteria bacterium]